jgi:O-methyltransferase
MLKVINKLLKFLGHKLVKIGESQIPVDANEHFIDVYYKTKHYSMTSPERMHAAYSAVEYIEKNNIEGSIVECGVWRGGSSMVMALKLMQMGLLERSFYLYDTYEGMSEPTNEDVDYTGKHSLERLSKEDKYKGRNIWCYASLNEVKTNMKSTGYPEDKINYIQGKVEETIPEIIPEKIAILRLDTDWYESTKHELKHLFPLLSKHGVLIIDDYGFWKGSKKAVDEYFAESGIFPFLSRIDNSGRLYIKL